MNWLSSFYLKHPEYRRLRVARRSPTSIHFELEPRRNGRGGLYEAHFQIKPILERAGCVWMPPEFAALGRLIGASVRNPRVALDMALALPFATVLTLQPAAATGQDTAVLLAQPTWNNGVLEYAWWYTNRKLLIRFPLLSIPSASICTAATLTLTLVSVNTSNSTGQIFHISSANGAWIEGTKNRAVAGAGEPCWNAREANGAGGVTTAWAGSAGLSTATTDYITPAMGTCAALSTDPIGTQYAFSLNVAIVQSWFGLATNNGMLGYPTAYTGDPSMATSDNLTAGSRPQLVVTYSLPGGGILNPTFSAKFRGPFG